MNKLVQSSVVFSEVDHTYTLDGKHLSGITSLIHAVKKLGVYEDANEYVRTVIIPKAGDYGTSVHHAIEFLDQTGLRQYEYQGKFATYDLTAELDNYEKMKEGFEAVANEYTVSDNIRYASQIDNVWRRISDGTLWLMDTKTNNLAYYPGGKEALQEYLSWQLSIYARLFELQNPGLKVTGLGGNWIRHDDYEQWDIERKSDADVDELLSTPWHLDEEGKIIYDIPDETMPEKVENQVLCKSAIDALVEVSQLAAFYKEKEAQMKETLMAAMKEHGIKSWDAEVFKATYTPATTAKSFDSTRFKAENPELYNQYMKESEKKESIRITLRK